MRFSQHILQATSEALCETEGLSWLVTTLAMRRVTLIIIYQRSIFWKTQKIELQGISYAMSPGSERRKDIGVTNQFLPR